MTKPRDVSATPIIVTQLGAGDQVVATHHFLAPFPGANLATQAFEQALISGLFARFGLPATYDYPVLITDAVRGIAEVYPKGGRSAKERYWKRSALSRACTDHIELALH